MRHESQTVPHTHTHTHTHTQSHTQTVTHTDTVTHKHTDYHQLNPRLGVYIILFGLFWLGGVDGTAVHFDDAVVRVTHSAACNRGPQLPIG